MYGYGDGFYVYQDHTEEKPPSWKKFKDEKDKLAYELMIRGIDLKKITNTEIPSKTDEYDNMLLRKK